MKNRIVIILVVLVSLQSCATYQKVPVSLDEAKDQGKVKIVDSKGQRRTFDMIIKSDTAYYGRKKSYTAVTGQISNYFLIPHSEDLTIYLSQPQPYRVWIKFRNREENVGGVLFGITDSSLLVSNTKKISDYKKFRDVSARTMTSNEVFNIKEVKVGDIEIIKTRRINSIGKGVLIGALAGFSYGATLDADFWIITGAAMAILSAPVGGIIGSSKLKVPIRGSIHNYNRNRMCLYPLHNYIENKIEPIPITYSLSGYEQGWKAYFSKNELNEIRQNETKDRPKNIDGLLLSVILIPLVLILGGLF